MKNSCSGDDWFHKFFYILLTINILCSVGIFVITVFLWYKGSDEELIDE